MPSFGDPSPEPARYLVDRGRGYSLSVFDLGLACCAVEFVAASMAHPDLLRLDEGAAEDGRRRVEVLVVSGTVTDKMAPGGRAVYDRLPEPRDGISFGPRADSGGPYWDSYCVTKGVDQILPVDVYVPGCPPRPEALVHGLLTLEEKLGGALP